jgi:hypothetical protein
MKRVEGYMTRAEQLREMMEKNAAPKVISSTITAELGKLVITNTLKLLLVLTELSLFRGDKSDDEETDTETAKLRSSLACKTVFTVILYYFETDIQHH